MPVDLDEAELWTPRSVNTVTNKTLTNQNLVYEGAIRGGPDGYVLTSNGPTAQPTWQALPTQGWIMVPVAGGTLTSGQQLDIIELLDDSTTGAAAGSNECEIFVDNLSLNSAHTAENAVFEFTINAITHSASRAHVVHDDTSALLDMTITDEVTTESSGLSTNFGGNWDFDYRVNAYLHCSVHHQLVGSNTLVSVNCTGYAFLEDGNGATGNQCLAQFGSVHRITFTSLQVPSIAVGVMVSNLTSPSTISYSGSTFFGKYRD